MKMNNKVTSLIIAVLLGAGAILLTLQRDGSLPASSLEVPTNGEISASPKKGTVAESWRWDELKKNNTGNFLSDQNKMSNKRGVEEVPFDVVFIYESLQDVRLDENKNVVIDHDTLTALNEALDENVLALDQRGLDKLQELIKIGLPGKPGEQTARIVGDYFNYLNAKKEFNKIYPANKDSPNKLQDYRAQYQELLALRNLYLGEDVAQRLFEQEDIDAEYMFATMNHSSSSSVPNEAKETP
ncbi:hypothetical protein NBRC116493_09320 [Aurantivibrio infirmus]